MQGEVRPPVDRDRNLGRDAPDGLRRRLRIEVAAPPERGAPAPDRNEADVDLPDLVHGVEEVGVPGEVDGARALDDIAQRLPRGSERPAARVVLGRHGPDAEGADLERLAVVHLKDAAEALLA